MSLTPLLIALRAAPRGAEVKDLAAATGLGRKQVATECGLMTSRGWAERVRKGVFRLTHRGRQVAEAAARGERAVRPGPYAPLTGVSRRANNTFADRLWRALRIRVIATVPQLLERALTERERPRGKALAHYAAKYLGALDRAGYVAVKAARQRASVPSPGSNGHKVWRLIRNTGPEAPIWRKRSGQIFDPNTRERFPC